jgi:23S rRNA pseudouridine1911/1915/1917 synthase
MSDFREDVADYSVQDAPQMMRQVPRECAGLRLDQALARMFPEHSRTRLAGWLREGRICLNATHAKAHQKVWGGETVRLQAPHDARDRPPAAEAMPLKVAYEDEAVLVIDKPAGLVVHPGSGNWSGTLLNALLHHAPQLAAVPRAGIVHRLDKDTSGLLVVAKTLEAQTCLVRQLQARCVERVYLALVHGVLAGDGSVEAPVGRHPRMRTRMAVVPAGKPALTHYRVLRSFSDATLLECTLATGRTHQIRVHLHSIGHPLVGDPVYKSARHGASPVRFPRQALHAARLAFVHPVSKKRRVFGSELPSDMRRLIASLGAPPA